MTRRHFASRGLSVACSYFIPAWKSSFSIASTPFPSKQITLGCIGIGRMGQTNMKNFLGFNNIKVIAVCDVDSRRRVNACDHVNMTYNNKDCKSFERYEDLLAMKDLDAVSIATPDHWHALPAIAAANAGKDIFIEKPLTYSIDEGRLLCNAANAKKSVVQVNSWQRSDVRFRMACELVRNGYLGKLKRVTVFLKRDVGNIQTKETAPPPTLNYDLWSGPSKLEGYREDRVHPQIDYGRPGWMKCEDYSLGMITNWGAHHIDIAHWGMGCEYTGPLSVEGNAQFLTNGIWDVHESINLKYTYPFDIEMTVCNPIECENGVRFEGSSGTIFVTRGRIESNPPELVKFKLNAQDKPLYKSNNHIGNFIESVAERKEPIAPVEIGHRTNCACILGWIAIKTERKLIWDAQQEIISNDSIANSMCKRINRLPYTI